MSTTNSIKLLTGNSHGGLAKLVADRYAKITKKSLDWAHSSFHVGVC